MSVKTLRATAKSMGGFKVEAESRGFKVIMDEPAIMGGNDTGMNPMQLALCALGGCQTIVATAFAKMKGIDLQEFWTEVEGDFDPRGFKGVEGVRAGYSEIRFKMHFKSNSSKDKLKKFADFIEKTCPVGDTFSENVKMIRTDVIIEK